MTDNQINDIPTTEIVTTNIDQPVPVFGGEEMVKALDMYLDLQSKLDQKMPEAIVCIGNKKFRTKKYWRTIARAFGLSVGAIQGSEDRLETDGDWGYKVTYRAETKTGTFADGDGACMCSEKFGDSGTLHNVRSHAHTRAFNRAVSNLCGFGEVSADEVSPSTGLSGPSNSETMPISTSPAQKSVGATQAPSKPNINKQPNADSGEAKSKTIRAKISDQLLGNRHFPATETKQGEKNGKDWKMFIVRFDNGESGATFEEEIFQYAESCHKREVTVDAVLIPRPKKNPNDTYQSWTLQSLSEVRDIQDDSDGKKDGPSDVGELITAADIPF